MSVQGTKVKEVKLSLKLMVDSKAKRVVFAEAGKDFVDFLFHILSLPLATVVKLLKNETTGGLLALYNSVESLKTEYFEPDVNRDTVLLPKHPIILPLLSLRQNLTTLSYFKCPDHSYVSFHEGATCAHRTFYYAGEHYDCKKPMTDEVTYTFVLPTSENGLSGFVKKSVPYIVMDNLEVKPMSLSLIKSLISECDYLVEDEVHFGLKEGLALLRASLLETNDVLTTVFLGSKNKALK